MGPSPPGATLSSPGVHCHVAASILALGCSHTDRNGAALQTGHTNHVLLMQLQAQRRAEARVLNDRTNLFLHSEEGAYVVRVPTVAVMGGKVVALEAAVELGASSFDADEFYCPVLRGGDIVYGTIEYHPNRWPVSGPASRRKYTYLQRDVLAPVTEKYARGRVGAPPLFAPASAGLTAVLLLMCTSWVVMAQADSGAAHRADGG